MHSKVRIQRQSSEYQAEQLGEAEETCPPPPNTWMSLELPMTESDPQSPLALKRRMFQTFLVHLLD